MRGCQYFGLIWVLCAIAAAVMPNGLLMGIFFVLSGLSGGLALYLLGLDMGLLGEAPKEAPRPASSAKLKEPRQEPARDWKNKVRDSFGRLVK
ncbi:protein of unknown function [Magnetospira sp. QH-2]|nr:protein of unknown function [Magnetospira sp. QH-2]